jgi:hypothetical protein
MHSAMFLPSLGHLELRYVVFDRLTHFENLLRPHLRRLRVVSISLEDYATQGHLSVAVDKEIEQDIIVEQKPCRLEYLEYTGSGLFSNLLLADVTNLHSLSLSYGGKHDVLGW